MDFNTSNSIGKRGELAVTNYLTEKNFTVLDASSHKLFQQLDIDFVAGKDGKLYTIDVKTDTHTTGNFYLEITSNDTKQTDGCLYASQADYWWYWFEKLGECYIFNPKEVATYVRENESKYRKVKHGSTGYGGRTLYHSIGVLIPVTDLVKAGLITQVVNI